MRPEFVEARASLLQFLDLFGRCGDVLRLRPQDRIHGAGMADEGAATGAAQRCLRVFPGLLLHRLLPGPFPFRPCTDCGARRTVSGVARPVEHPVYDVWLKGCKEASEIPPPEAAAGD